MIAGPPDQVDAVMAVVADDDRLARRIEVDVASHHRIVEPILPELLSELADLAPDEPAIPVISTTCDPDGDAPAFDAGHWAANLRNPVRFSQAVATAGANHATFIEVSPHPLLTHAINDALGAIDHQIVSSLQRDADDTLVFHSNLNASHTTNQPRTPHPPEPHPSLPTAPWHHTHHWIGAVEHRARLAGDGEGSGGRTVSVHPLLGAHCAAARGAGASRVGGRSRDHGPSMARRPPGARGAGLPRCRLLRNGAGRGPRDVRGRIGGL